MTTLGTLKKYVVLATGLGILTGALTFPGATEVLADGMKPLLVQVISGPLTPVFVRNIDAPTNEPIQAEVCFPPSSSFCQGQGVGSSITVPTTNAAGRAVERMTLEYVSGVCFNNLVFIEAQVLSTVGGAGPVRHHLIPVPGEPGWTHFAQPVRIYGDAGTIIRIGGTTNGEGACDFAFSGHLTLR